MASIKSLLFLFLFSLLTACSITSVKQYRDPVKSLQIRELRFTKFQDYGYTHNGTKMKGSTDFLNPLIKSQVVVRTSTGKNGKVEVFELMEMHASSYDIKDTCYLATDKKLFPIKVKNIKTEQITVHTSKLDDQRTISRFSFELSKDMQQQILTSKSISFIQCAGPSMISLELYNLDIRPLKRLISSHLKGE